MAALPLKINTYLVVETDAVILPMLSRESSQSNSKKGGFCDFSTARSLEKEWPLQ